VRNLGLKAARRSSRPNRVRGAAARVVGIAPFGATPGASTVRSRVWLAEPDRSLPAMARQVGYENPLRIPFLDGFGHTASGATG
jgi:hypothetical protein